MLFPVLLSGVWIVLVLSRRRPIVITIIIGALKQVLPLVLDFLEDHLRAQHLLIFVHALLVLFGEAVAVQFI